MLVIPWQDFRFNPLLPLDARVSIVEYRNEFARTFCDFMQFWERGASIFLRGLDALYRDFRVYERWSRWSWKTPFPTLYDLFELFRSKSFQRRVAGRGKESIYSIMDKLEGFLIEAGPIVACQRGFDLTRLVHERETMNLVMDGLGVAYQNLLIATLLLSYSAYFKVAGPRGRLNALLVFDEAKGLVGEAQQKNFMMKDLVSKVREFGIGLVCADQIPSEIAQFYKANIGTLVMFRVSDGSDLLKLRYSSAATPEQSMENYALQPGECVARTMKSKDLVRFRVPHEPVEKFIGREELERLIRPRIVDLEGHVIGPASRGEHGLVLEGKEREFLTCLARDFDRPSGEVYRDLGWSQGEGHRVKERLRKRRCLSQVRTNLGKDRRQAVFLIPNALALEELGIPLKGDGRGGALHRHFQAKLKAMAEALGWVGEIEPGGSGGEAPDLGLEREGLRVAVEVCVTSKPRTEASNVEKCLGLGFDRVVLSFVSSAVLEKTRKLVAEQTPALLDRVRFCLVNQVMENLEK